MFTALERVRQRQKARCGHHVTRIGIGAGDMKVELPPEHRQQHHHQQAHHEKRSHGCCAVIQTVQCAPHVNSPEIGSSRRLFVESIYQLFALGTGLVEPLFEHRGTHGLHVAFELG